MKRTVLWIMLLCVISASLLVVASATGAPDKPLTNPDVIKMIKAKLGEETIVRAIQNSTSDFDTSPDALIFLKQQGATDKILDAVLTAKATKSSEVQVKPGDLPGAPAQSTDTLAFGEVVLVDGNTRTRVKQAAAGYQTKHSWLWATTWWVIQRSQSDFRITNPTPTFEFGIPVSVRATDHVKLVKPEVTDTFRQFELQVRDVIAANTAQKRIVPIVFEELKGGVMPGVGLVGYRVRPASPLPPGEYILTYGGMAFYDFGIDAAR